MLLTIDCGNTNFVFAVFDGDTLRGSWCASSDPHRTSDEYAVWLTHLMSFNGLEVSDIDGAIIASVVPDALYPLARLCSYFFKTDPLIVGRPEVRLPLDVAIDRPETVGADRLANAIAAHARYGGPLIVVDFGTATNFDVVNKDGAFIGGVLAPGVDLSAEALASAAAKLPKIRIRRPDRVIGTSTESALESGIFWGYVGLVEGLVIRIQEEHGAPMTVVATGGLASLFDRASDLIQYSDMELTLRGLLAIYRYNKAADAS